MDLITGPTVAVMFYQAFCFWGCDIAYVATYRDLETCRARIEVLKTNYNMKGRYCRLEAVVQK